MSEIKLGPIEGFVVHFGRGIFDAADLNDVRLCRDTPFAVRKIHTWTTDRAKVTCQGCLEWLHA